MTQPERIISRSNPLLVQLRRLQHDGAAYRRHGLLWIEGEHLCAAALARHWRPRRVLLGERAWAEGRLRALVPEQADVAVLPDALFAEHSTLESPAAIGYVLDAPASADTGVVQAGAPSVVLDRLQDPGNVGSILRSAAAFGFGQVLALKGTAALWSPKVLRAGMGAHFGLRLVEGLEAERLDALQLPLVATSSHAERALPDAPLPKPCAWLFGHEGQGVDPRLAARCAFTVRIPQPGGEESLNVAAAAAVCLYESMRRAQAQ